MALRIRDLVRVLSPALLFALFVPLSLPATAHADGRIFVREKVPPTIPYQRALIIFDEGKETLVLQSKYALPTSGASDGAMAAPTSATAALGWVVPVPAVPDIDTMPADAASDLFLDLSRDTRTDVIGWMEIFPGLIFLLSLLGLLTFRFSSIFIVPRWVRAHRQGIFDLAILGLFFDLLCAIIIPNFLGTSSAGLDVIKEQRVGIYDVKVIQSDDSSQLIEWLNDNSFVFGEVDRAAFDRYIRDGWCFVVARVNPSAIAEGGSALAGKGQPHNTVQSEGLVAPLILHFPHDTPVYPLALTAAGGHKTEVLIYLVAKSKMTCGDRLPLRHAEPWWTPSDWWSDYQEVLSMQIPQGWRPSPYFLTKFRGTLTPEQMREDLTFSPVADNEYYREWIVRW